MAFFQKFGLAKWLADFMIYQHNLKNRKGNRKPLNCRARNELQIRFMISIKTIITKGAIG